MFWTVLEYSPITARIEQYYNVNLLQVDSFNLLQLVFSSVAPYYTIL